MGVAFPAECAVTVEGAFAAAEHDGGDMVGVPRGLGQVEVVGPEGFIACVAEEVLKGAAGGVGVAVVVTVDPSAEGVVEGGAVAVAEGAEAVVAFVDLGAGGGGGAEDAELVDAILAEPDAAAGEALASAPAFTEAVAVGTATGVGECGPGTAAAETHAGLSGAGQEQLQGVMQKAALQSGHFQKDDAGPPTWVAGVPHWSVGMSELRDRVQVR